MRSFALVGALVAGVGLAGPAGTAAAAEDSVVKPAVVGATPAVAWGTCESDVLAGVPADQVKFYSCARYRVPVDHDDASLGTIDIALLKRAARTPDKRVGSLFLNPGGPGGPGLTMPIAGQAIFRPQVLDRFDLIGFDPRGVGASNPLRCFTTQEDADEVFAAQVGVPISRAEISGTLASYRDYGRFCKNNAGSLLDHMSTKDVVRDLDTLRAAVGDRKLNYVGFSYGTLIGSTYAAMFPKQSRAIVIDGNVDPALRTSDGVQYDRERAQGFEIALDAFLKRCDQAGPKCAFSDGNPRAKFDELREYLRKQPITLPGSDPLDISEFTGTVGGVLYSPGAFAALADWLQTYYTAIHPSAQAQAQTQSLRPRPLTAPALGHRGLADLRPDSPYTGDDSYFAVNCADKPFRIRQEQVPDIAAKWERESRTFGRSQAFSDTAACPVWPAKKPDAYRGPWRAKTDVPVVVVGNFYDPATRYKFAQRMAAELGNSRLLSVDAFGHCILGDALGVDQAVADYLTDLEVPANGQVFQPNVQPFGV
ncbi:MULTISPECIES: alpha/beta hydrolase [unclassified Amycolatopsis]|uniref:alpha/beta hydrolase n=1 Tax=unclassified Amycolatopsis TaxID=2618356 RepID=UPI002876F988|nr:MULTISPECIES: alpha/beta hydrolase [unclassified Amycolatopsis]MDS0137019.1 alpha/beta fold hydrolase [Amycolatopsis sp. 505]MDS0143684.1 alpha/beta fold hydrolase [Amycolatopsis sp. CM201R]